jgi:hypothetical protein
MVAMFFERIGKTNTPEASGTARKAPSGSLLGEPSRSTARASLFSLQLVTKHRPDPELDRTLSAVSGAMSETKDRDAAV